MEQRTPVLLGFQRSNRTFMELKLFDNEASQLLHGVLIVPLWN